MNTPSGGAAAQATAAWQALLSSDPDAAIAQFLTSGYDYAVRLSAERKARNADFAKEQAYLQAAAAKEGDRARILAEQQAKEQTGVSSDAEDLQRYGRGEPIAARRAGRLERLTRWVRRHPAAAGLLAAIIIVYSSTAEKTLYPLLLFAQVVPKIAIAPLFIV